MDRFNLILVARNRERLEAVAGELRRDHRVEVAAICQDLAQPGAAGLLFDGVTQSGRTVSVLINNAGFGLQGEFVKTDPARYRDMIQVNIIALVELARLFAAPMAGRREGRILNVASTGAFLPGPGMNVYYATKAFVHSFSNAISRELAGSGVTVSTLYPGPTRTEFFERAGMKRPEPMMMEVRQVARAGYDGMMRGRRMIVPGLVNKLSLLACRLGPTWLQLEVSRRLNQP